MIKILNRVSTISHFIENDDLLKNKTVFDDRKIFVNDRCIAELEDDGYFRSRELNGYDFLQLKTLYKFLALCQTYLTIESKEARKMQEQNQSLRTSVKIEIV